MERERDEIVLGADSPKKNKKKPFNQKDRVS